MARHILFLKKCTLFGWRRKSLQNTNQMSELNPDYEVNAFPQMETSSAKNLPVAALGFRS